MKHTTTRVKNVQIANQHVPGRGTFNTRSFVFHHIIIDHIY